MRISCVLSKCPDLVCLRPGVAERAWNEANPVADEVPTLPNNQIPSRMNKAPTIVEYEVELPKEWSEV